MSKLFKHTWSRWLVIILLCLLIYLATDSAAYTADSTREFFGLFNVVARKSTHVTAFGLLALLVRWALDGKRSAWLWAWSIATLYGATDEWHQLFVPGRGGSINDVLLNSVGAFSALLILHLWLRRKVT